MVLILVFSLSYIEMPSVDSLIMSYDSSTFPAIIMDSFFISTCFNTSMNGELSLGGFKALDNSLLNGEFGLRHFNDCLFSSLNGHFITFIKNFSFGLSDRSVYSDNVSFYNIASVVNYSFRKNILSLLYNISGEPHIFYQSLGLKYLFAFNSFFLIPAVSYKNELLTVQTSLYRERFFGNWICSFQYPLGARLFYSNDLGSTIFLFDLYVNWIDEFPVDSLKVLYMPLRFDSFNPIRNNRYMNIELRNRYIIAGIFAGDLSYAFIQDSLILLKKEFINRLYIQFKTRSLYSNNIVGLRISPLFDYEPSLEISDSLNIFTRYGDLSLMSKLSYSDESFIPLFSLYFKKQYRFFNFSLYIKNVFNESYYYWLTPGVIYSFKRSIGAELSAIFK